MVNSMLRIILVQSSVSRPRLEEQCRV